MLLNEPSLSTMKNENMSWSMRHLLSTYGRQVPSDYEKNVNRFSLSLNNGSACTLLEFNSRSMLTFGNKNGPLSELKCSAIGHLQ